MPRKDWSSPRLVGNGHSWMALHFAGSAFKPSLETIWPKYSSSGRPNAYFFILACKPAVCNYYRTQQRCCSCAAADHEKMRISSKYTVQKTSRLAQSILFMSLWNVAGALHNWMEEHNTQRVQKHLKCSSMLMTLGYPNLMVALG